MTDAVVVAREEFTSEELAGLLERASKVFSHVAIVRTAVRAQLRDRAAALAVGTDELLHLCALAVLGEASTAEIADALGKPQSEAGRLMRELASEHLVTSATWGATLRWSLDGSGRSLCEAAARGGLLQSAHQRGGDTVDPGERLELRRAFETLAGELGVAPRLAVRAGVGELHDAAEQIEGVALVERVYRALRRQQATHLSTTSAGALDTPSFMVLDLLRSGPKPAKVLCERLGLNYSRLLAVIGGLERGGLVDRRRRRDEVGTVEIHPTAVGAALIATMTPFDPGSRFLDCMARLDRDGALDKLVQDLQFYVSRIGRGHVYPPRYDEVARDLAEAMTSGQAPGLERPVPPATFRAAMGEFATGVAIVTVATGSGGRALTVNSFTSVSLEPPIVLVCLKREIPTLAAIEECGKFGVNVLPDSMESLARRFGTHEGPDNPHSLVDVEYRQEQDIPRLAGALAWFGCRVDQVVDAGDHVIVLGMTDQVRTWQHELLPPPALFFWRGRFGAMP